MDKVLLAQLEEEIARLEKEEKLQTCLDSANIHSKPTETQLAIFAAINSTARYRNVSGGNQSGKTSVLVRELTWVLNDTHPYWQRPIDHTCNNRFCRNEDTEKIGDPTVPRYRCHKCGNIWEPWGKDEAINILLVGQNRLNLTQNLWLPRIKPLLKNPEEWREVKIGAMIAWIENRRNGDKVLLMPHGRGEEVSRQSVQGFSIHFAYLDELAPAKVAEEVQRRVDAKLGYYLAAYTMKKIDNETLKVTQKLIESGAMQQFKISKLDNPKYAGMKDIILAQLAGLSPEQVNAYLYGDAEDSDTHVFALDSRVTKQDIPINYSKNSWPHVAIVDPACLSKAGFMLIARDPNTDIWHTIRAEYWPGMQDPADLIAKVEHEIRHVHVIARICDNQAWYYGPARKQGIMYKCPPNKQKKDGKVFIIKKAQTFIASGRIRIAAKFEDLWYELESYRWAEDGKNIVNSNKYHIIDCLVYFVDALPKEDFEKATPLTADERIRLLNRMAAGKTAAGANKVLQSPKNSISILKGNAATSALNRLGIKTWKI